METNKNKIELLEKYDFIPSGLNLPLDIKILDARGTCYEYYGYKYAESNEMYENCAVSIQFKHSQAENPFWITIFEGATYRESNTSCIISTLEPTIDENYTVPGGTIYNHECITKNEGIIDGIESLNNLLFAFKCKLITGDESGLYCKHEPVLDDDPDAIRDLAEELKSLSFVHFNYSIPIENANPDLIKEMQEKLQKISIRDNS